MTEETLHIIGGRGFRGPKLDEKLCFDLWLHRGTCKKAALALERDHKIINKRTGKPYSEMAINKASKRYALKFPDEAREVWEAKYGKVRDDLWLDYLSRISKELLTSSLKAYQEWMKNHPEVVAYENSLSD